MGSNGKLVITERDIKRVEKGTTREAKKATPLDKAIFEAWYEGVNRKYENAPSRTSERRPSQLEKQKS